MKLPTQEQINAGNKMAELLINASVLRDMGNVTLINDNGSAYEYSDVVQMYINNEIDSVTAIWIAMNDEEYMERRNES